MVCSRQRGGMAVGFAKSLGEWIEFHRLLQAERLEWLWGSPQMITDIEEVIPEGWREPMESVVPSWVGAFSCLEILIAVKGCVDDQLCLFFEMTEAGRIQ